MSNLQIPCPSCGMLFDLEVAMDSVDGKQFVELLTSLPPTAIRPVFNYLKLFKPKKQVLSWAKALKLLSELAPMIKAARIKRGGIDYVIPLAHWEQALMQLVNDRPTSLALPLKSHGYLLSMLAAQAEKQAAIQEEKTEQHKRSGAAITRQPLEAEPSISFAELQALAAEKQQQRKPSSKPPANWNPLREHLPKLLEPTLPGRDEINAAEQLLNQPSQQDNAHDD